jgi:hypothetical protein
MSRCTGWLLNFSGGAAGVIGQHELLHLIQQPQTHEVPGAPAYCRRVLIWERGILPVLDVGVWSDPATIGIAAPVIAIVAFQLDGDPAPGFGGLALTTAAQRIDVDDAWACTLPPLLNRWRPISWSCFVRDHRPLPILNLARLFAPANLAYQNFSLHRPADGRQAVGSAQA